MTTMPNDKDHSMTLGSGTASPRYLGAANNGGQQNGHGESIFTENVADTINAGFGTGGIGFNTDDFNTEHADDAVDFENISLTDESDFEESNNINGKDNRNSNDKHSNNNNLDDDGFAGLANSSMFNTLFGNFDGFGAFNGELQLQQDQQKDDIDQASSALHVSSEKRKEINGDKIDKAVRPSAASTQGDDNATLSVSQNGGVIGQMAAGSVAIPVITPQDSQYMHYYYPTFRRNKAMRLHQLLKMMPARNSIFYKYFHQHCFKSRYVKPLIPLKVELDLCPDDRQIFNNVRKKKLKSSSLEYENYHLVRITPQSVQRYLNQIFDLSDSKQVSKFRTSIDDTLLASSVWNDDAIINGEPLPKTNNFFKPDYQVDDLLDYNDDDIINGNFELLKVELDLRDSKLVFAPLNEERRTPRSVSGMTAPSSKKVETKTLSNNKNGQTLLHRFNVSNDEQYDVLKHTYHSKIRATIGNLAIDHTIPSINLQSPFYKVKLSKHQLRFFHRSKFLVRPNTVIHFLKLKLRKRKKDKGKDIKESFRRTKDLSLGDTAQFYMFEYSEQQPLILNNFGMGSKIVNYYRQKSDSDTFRPKCAIGETHVIGHQDRSPFWNFGFVDAGKVVPSLYNQMMRAPIFQHNSNRTDFLLVKSSINNKSSKYYLRKINKVLLVGQTYPVTEIPGPHARKVTAISKNRLKMIVYRVLNHSKRKRIQVKDISKHFPDQNDMQNRQRLKEFMVYQRTGPDQGYWKIKPNEVMLNFDEIKSMISPEDLCLLESMQVGQQHLDDYEIYSFDNIDLSKYTEFISAFNQNNHNVLIKEDLLPIQQQSQQNGVSQIQNGNNSQPGGILSTNGSESLEENLAPWNTTKNFINATQGKAMLQLHGEGEPTGCGEGISFLRTSMKGGFKSFDDDEASSAATPATPSSNVGGSVKKGHSYSVAAQQKAYDEEIKKIWDKQVGSLSSEEPISRSDILPNTSRYNSRKFLKSKDKKKKILKITRMVVNQYGVVERQTEVLKDERIINAYLYRKRQILKAKQEANINSMLVNGMGNTQDIKVPTNELEKQLLQQELAKLQQQIGGQSGRGIGKGKNTKRRCTLCGAVGHIRTKKSCPMYGKVPGSGTATPSAGGDPESSVSTPNINNDDPNVPASSAASPVVSNAGISNASGITTGASNVNNSMGNTTPTS